MDQARNKSRFRNGSPREGLSTTEVTSKFIVESLTSTIWQYATERGGNKGKPIIGLEVTIVAKPIATEDLIKVIEQALAKDQC